MNSCRDSSANVARSLAQLLPGLATASRQDKTNPDWAELPLFDRSKWKRVRFGDVVKQMNQTAEGLASVAPILALAKARNVEMPIVEQVNLVLAGRLKPRDLAPHLTTDADEPQGERTLDDNQNRGRGSFWRPFKRTRN
jgi:hypothetical protein